MSSGERTALAQSVYRQARDMAEQVSKILQMTRLEAGGIEVDFDWASIAEIIGSAMAVLNELGPGLAEKLYENALIIELTSRGLLIEQQREFPVYNRERFIGKLIPDLVVEGKVIVDPKVVESFNDTHLAQMLGYLAISKLELAILVNFKYAKLQWKRVVRSAEEAPF